LQDIVRHVVEFSSDQNGSRFIQHKLETANGDEKDLVFREVQPNAIPLMKDLFGNYVVQKFFEHGTQIQKRVLLGAMKGQIHDLSMQMYACRVVQKVSARKPSPPAHLQIPSDADMCRPSNTSWWSSKRRLSRSSRPTS
jgi:hypothetical protein